MKNYAIAIERKTLEVWTVDARTSHEAVLAVADRQAAGEEPDRVTNTSRRVLSVKPVLADDDPKLPT